jgi:RimJ/RimL family protein N-acetyltransferase
MIPSLRTERLLLRSFRESDLDAYARMSADAEVMRYIGAGNTLSRDQAWRSMAFFLGHWQLRGYGMWAIEDRDSREMIGRAGFLEPEGWPGFELGWLLSREHWGKGFAFEAARAALGYAGDAVGRDTVISLIRPGNARSIKLAERLGGVKKWEEELLGGPILVYEIATQG